MNTSKIATIFLIVTASFKLQAEECSSILIDWSNYDKTLDSLSSNYKSENFLAVDSAIDCLMTSKNTFVSGKPGAVATYWFFRNEMHAPGANAEDVKRIEKWKSAVKGSEYANFAELRLMYSQAWNARGTKYAGETSADQFKRFKEKLLLTEKAILSDKNKLKDTPISYNLLMAVALDTNETKTSPTEIFEGGVSNWPNYYDFYEVLLTRLVPKWGGSWEKVDGFINHWDKKLQIEEGSSLYSRLYYNVHKHNQVNPHHTKAEWDKLKPSLIALYTNYPDQSHYEIATSYACYFGDNDFYKKLIKEHKVQNSSHWLAGATIDACNKYLSTLATK